MAEHDLGERLDDPGSIEIGSTASGYTAYRQSAPIHQEGIIPIFEGHTIYRIS